MSLPEAFTHQDKLLTVDTNLSKFLEGLLHPGIKAHPLFLDPYNGVWVLRVKFAPGVTLPLHFHTGTVHLYTMSGCWYYSEYPDRSRRLAATSSSRAARSTSSTRRPPIPRTRIRSWSSSGPT